jgi:tripartite-type tricarboxylate transporter receptor subunit TctC
MAVSRRRFLLTGSAAIALGVFRNNAAQAYPDRPIRLIVPFPPGGVNDAVARPWAEAMKTQLGTVVIENIGGAGGSLGAATVARAQPDGYTILLGNTGTVVIHPIAQRRPSYDPIESFDPIAILGLASVGIVVHPSVPAQNLHEFIGYAKAQGAKLSYGSPGLGTLSYVTTELFKSLAGTPNMVHVPYRGVGPAMIDLIAGRVQMMMPNVTSSVIAHHRAGQIRLLAVTSPMRLSAVPDIATAVEAGLPGMISQNFIGLFAPARTPRPMLDRIAEATRVAMTDLERVYLATGFEPNLNSNPDTARASVEAQVAQWTPVIKSIGLKLD